MHTVSTDRFLNMREAGMHIGQSYRWMQRNYIALIKDGVKALAEVLPFNQIIEVLDLSKNQLGVPGAT